MLPLNLSKTLGRWDDYPNIADGKPVKFTASQNLWTVVLSFLFVSRYSFISSLISSVIPWLLSCILFSHHVFVCFRVCFLSHGVVIRKDA